MKNHFRRVTELAVPIHAICRKKYFPGSTLCLVAPAEESLVLTLAGIVPVPIDSVAVSYSVDSYLYTFEAKVTEAQTDQDKAATLLTMDLPERIARIERRKSPRVKCNRQYAVTLRLDLRSGESLESTVIDIGRHGAGFLLPNGPVVLQVGDAFPALLTLPKLGELHMHVVVRVATDTRDGARVGVEFLDPTDEDADMLRQYVHLRQLQIRTEQRSAAKTPPTSEESIFVVAIKDTLGNKQLVLCTDAFLGQIAGPGTFSEIVSVDVIEYLVRG